MLRFVIKFLLLLSTLLFGILLGIQQAEFGIFTLEGGIGPKQVQAEKEQEQFFVKKVDEDQVEVAVMADPFTLQDLLDKQELWQERNQRNALSTLGSKFGDAVYSISRKGAEWFVSQLEKAL